MGKSLIKNSIYNLLYKLFNILYPLISSAYLARVLLPEGVGKVAFAQNIVTYFVTLASLGIPNYGTKIIGSFQTDTEERNKCFSELFLINFISSNLFFGGFVLFLTRYGFGAEPKLLVILGLQIILNVFNVDWVYQGLEEYRYIVRRNIIVKLFSLVLLFYFVRSAEDYGKYAGILVLALCGNYICNMFHLKRYVCFSLAGIGIVRHLKPIFILLGSTCATELYTLLDSTIVGLLCSEKELAYYANSVKLVRAFYGILSSVCIVFLPRLSFYYNSGFQDKLNQLANKGLKISLYLSIPSSIGCFLLAEPLVNICYGEAFQSSVSVVRIISVLIMIFSIAYIAGHVILLVCNQETWILIATVSGAAVNLILNILTVSRFRYMGVAFSSVIAEAIVTIIMLFQSRKRIKYNVDMKFLLSIFISGWLMTIAIIVCVIWIENEIIKLFLSCITGGSVYIAMTIILKNEIAKDGVCFFKSLIGRYFKPFSIG